LPFFMPGLFSCPLQTTYSERLRLCEPYGDGQAAFGACGGGEGGVVSLGDGVDDGEAEAVAVGAAVTVGRQFLEGSEETLDLVVGDDWPAVGDRQARLRARGLSGDLYVPAWMVVADGVVDEVGDEAFDQSPVPGRHCGREVFGEVDAFPCCLVVAGGEHSSDDLGEVEGVAAGDAALAGGQGEQCLDEPFLVFAKSESLLAGRAQGVGVGVGVREGDFEEGPQAGERGS